MLKARDKDQGTLVLTAKNNTRTLLKLRDGFWHRHFLFATLLSAVTAESYEMHQTQKQIENRN